MMANPPRQKGTGGETELLRLLDIDGLVRNPSSSLIDLSRPGWNPALEVLATRPDHGQWLFTMNRRDFQHLVGIFDEVKDPFVQHLDIEVKRYSRFAMHSIFEQKYSR